MSNKNLIKKDMKRISLIILIISVIISSCKNSSWEYPDYVHSAVYFAYQTPVRTIVLGTDDLVDNSLDNAWQCQIFATVGGFYEIKKDIEVTFKVDNSLCENLDNVTAMPSHYYSLSDNSKMVIKKGSKFIGGVVVQLTEAFFADPLALSVNYVIPLVITAVNGADGILTGIPADGVINPNRLNPDDWQTPPKDYILYAIKFINPYDVVYLRRGTDNITIDGVQSTEPRKGTYSPEDDEVMEGANRVKSISLTELEFPVNNHRPINNVNLNMTFKLNFSSDGKCTFANGVWKDSQLVDEYTVGDFRVFDIVISGSGEYIIEGEKKSWGNKDRDVLKLTYQVEYKLEYEVEVESDEEEEPDEDTPPQIVTSVIKYVTSDVLVFRDRAISVETFEPVLKP